MRVQNSTDRRNSAGGNTIDAQHRLRNHNVNIVGKSQSEYAFLVPLQSLCYIPANEHTIAH